MPVYDYSYKTWEGERRGPLFRWLAIPKFTYMEFCGRKFFVWLVTIGCLQFFFRLGYLYLLVNQDFLRLLGAPVAVLASVDAFFFKNMIDIQLFFCFLVAFQIGAGLISRDLRHSAVVLYMSKPISKWEYFLGKFATLFSLMMLLTWFQTTLLFLIQAWIAPEHSEWHLYFWEQYAWILGAIALYSTVVSVTLSLMILAASSLTKNSRYAGTGFVVYIIGSSIVAGVVYGILHNLDLNALSPFFAGVDLGYYLFDLNENRVIMGEWAAWTGIIAVWVPCAIILKWRLTRAARYGR